MTDEDETFWSNFAPIALTIGTMVFGALLVTGVVECGSRVFRAYDRWECKQWCGAKGAKAWSPNHGCECRP